MNFELTEERQLLQDSLRRFLSDTYGPAERRGEGKDIMPGLAELGVLGAFFTEDDGGFGGSGFDLMVVFEELGRAGVIEPLIDGPLLCGRVLAELGGEKQRTVLEEIMAGGASLAFAHSETGARYDPDWVETRFENGALNGHKSVIAGGGVASSLLVSACTSGAPDDRDGIALFMVPANVPGVSIRSYPLAQGGYGADINLENVTAYEQLSDQAFPAIEQALAGATVAQCAETLGAMETALSMTRDYLGARRQFGRPLGSFQVLAHRLADLMLELEQARSAVILAAGHLDAMSPLRDRYCSAAKNLIGRVGRLVAEETIQMHGGIGMTAEYDLGHFAKRIIMADHRFGDTDYHLERFIARSA